MSTEVTTTTQAPSLLARCADRFGVDPAKMLVTLKATAFKGEVNNEQMMALLIVADQFKLNPWTREIYAFPDKGGIVPVVGVDGWARIINDNAQFDGMTFEQGADFCTCTIFRKDRAHPVQVTEYLAECRRETQPWKSHPKRMLRHKAMIQCARLAFGFGGIYDQDEAERIVERDITPAPESATVAEINETIKARKPRQTAPAPEDRPVPRPYTYAEIASQINGSATVDDVDVAADLIAEIPDAAQRAELFDLAKARRLEIGA